VALTAAGRVFLHHARLALSQIETAGEAARRAEQPDKPVFVVGFLSGQEVAWLPAALRILREESPGTEIGITSHSSPELAAGLMQGKVDVAILRRENAVNRSSLQVSSQRAADRFDASHTSLDSA